jgi:hypothetical protein
MEATYAGGRQYPPVHLHPNQLERFEVLEGVNLFEEFSDEIRLVPG